MRKILCITLGLSVIIALALREWSLLPDGRTHISFLSVGQGDSAIIRSPGGKTIVLDGGPDWSTLEAIGSHLPFFHRKIDALIFTHANLDHYASFPEILERYSVGMLLLSDVALHASWGKRITELAETKNVTIVPLHAGMTVAVDEQLWLRVLWPPSFLPKTIARDSNGTSLVMKVSDGKNAALFTGDIERIVEEILVASKADLTAEILKVPHHGSKTSSTDAFIRAVRPTIAVISVGADNSYGHPNADVVRRYEAARVIVKRTDRDGTIDVVW